MDSTVRLLFLGAPRVEYAGQQVGGFESRKAIVLLGYLASRGEATPRGQLVELFWPDQSDEHGRANLRRVLHNLATLLPSCLEVDRQTVRLVGASACWTDTIAFDALITQDILTALAAAAELYRGPFLDGLYLDDCPDVETWLAQERERWHERIAHVLADLAARHRERREWTAGLRYVDRLLMLDPWREAAHQDRMRLLALSGRREAALAQYEICQRILSGELGIDPSPEITTLYEQIRDGMLTPPAAAMAQRFPIPLPSTSLLGRANELTQITQLLAQPGCRLLTLLGPGGVGKTRLALEVVTQQQAHFSDGVCMVELASIHDPALVAPTITQALAVPENSNQPVTERLKTWLRDKHMLLYLDNFEQILTAAPLVRELLASSPQLKILVTSRIALRLRGEQEFSVGPLALPDLQHLHASNSATTLTRYAATALFVERSHSIKSDFTVTHANAPLIAEICARLDGLPLAIELAAAWSKLLPPSALLARLERRLPLLTSNIRDRPPHQQTIRNTIAWSYQLLDTQEQMLFVGLSVFVGGWTLEMAETTVVLDEMESLDVLNGLTTLVDHSLVRQYLADNGEPRFFMLETIREYALEQLEQSAISDRARQQHAMAFLKLAEDIRQRMPKSQQSEWRRQLEREHRNCMSALSWMREHGQTEQAIQLAWSLVRFWRMHGHAVEGLAILEDLLEQASTTPVRDLVHAHGYYTAAMLASAQGQLSRAQGWLVQSMHLYKSINNSVGIIRVLLILGGVAFDQGDLHKAIRHWLQLLPLSIAANELSERTFALGGLGEAYYHLGDLEQAKQYYDAALALARQLERSDLEAQQLTNLGNLALQLGNREQAAALQHQALIIWQELNEYRQLAITIEHLAAISVKNDRPLRAARLLGAAANLRRLINAPPAQPEQVENDHTYQAICIRLSDEASARAYNAGAALSFEAMMAETLAATSSEE